MVSSDRRERPSNHEGPGSQPSQPADPAHPSRPPNSSNSGTLRRPNRPAPRQRIPRPSARPHTPGMRPFTWPSSNHDAPTLWERAKAMFSALTTRFGSAMRVAFRRFLTSQRRRDLILHLEPAEKLVRVLMIAEVITLLVMTPMGLKLRQTTRPCRIPDPPPQVGAHKPHPGCDDDHRRPPAPHRPAHRRTRSPRGRTETHRRAGASASSTGLTTPPRAPRPQSRRAPAFSTISPCTHSTHQRASPSTRPATKTT